MSGGAQDLSANEFAATCLKAAAGAGAGWGAAAILAQGALWLESRGQPGAAVLAEALGRDPRRLGPAVARIGLCGAMPAGEDTLEGCAPLLVAGIAAATLPTGAALRIEWAQGVACVSPTGLALDGAGRAPCRVRLAACADAPPEVAPAPRLMPAPDAWAALEEMARAILVPASERSRADAGAGNIDND